ncbi:MAG: hypothetical protein Q9192_006638 [Flavoplaca navasiana]
MRGSVLHHLTEKECYIELIDSYRLRVEDDYNFAGDASGLYAGDDPREDFRRFLNLAEKRKGLLPKWWTKETRRACEMMGADKAEGNWASLFTPVEKRDIMEHYHDNLKPMKLRLLAEEVYGQRVQGGL